MSDQPTLWGFDPGKIGGKVGNDHPLTSHRAAAQVKSGSQKAQALFALRIHPDGLTGYEIADLIRNGAGRPISPNQACTRLMELRDGGLVDYRRQFEGGPPVERETTPGNTGIIHVLTGYGQQAVVILTSR